VPGIQDERPPLRRVARFFVFGSDGILAIRKRGLNQFLPKCSENLVRVETFTRSRWGGVTPPSAGSNRGSADD
jgi:hypothetical protein